MNEYVDFKEFTTCLVALYEEPRPPVEDWIVRLRWDTNKQFGFEHFDVVYGVKPTKRQADNSNPGTIVCWKCAPNIKAKWHWKRYVKYTDKLPPIFYCCKCHKSVGP